MVIGLGCIVASVLLVAIPLYGVWSRGRADASALSTWNQGGLKDMVGPVAGAAGTVHTKPTCGSDSSTDYALVTFPTLAQYGYAGVAGDGTWDELLQRSMVHYDTSPAPGQQGNVIIGFHREPDFQHINQLIAGDTVTIEDRTCHTFTYRISQRWQLDPTNVTQLGPTSGHELTLITCTPWFQDYQRYVWRGELVS